ncbi:MAG: hypothetical protein ACOX3H_08395 [Saccharofermentanales bacterium]|jgi:ABC-type transport system involved in multi-copper enzyme maturation permease subunit
MFNYTCMELRRLNKQKSTYVILLTAVILLFGLTLMLNISLKALGKLDNTGNNSLDKEPVTFEVSLADKQSSSPLTIEKEKNENPDPEKIFAESLDEHLDGEPLVKEETGDDLLLHYFSGYSMLIFLIIFAALFFTAPYQNGFIKNFLGTTRNRSKFIFAQFFTGIVFTILLFVVSVIVLLIAQHIFLADEFPFSDIGGMVKTLTYQLFAHIAFLSILLFVATVSGKMSMVLIPSFIYYLIGHKLIFDLLTMLIKKVADFGDDWHLRTYTVMGSIAQFTGNIETKNLIQPLLVCAIIMIVAIGASCLTLQRKDI